VLCPFNCSAGLAVRKPLCFLFCGNAILY
jgi:hypothetical protein